MQLLYRLLELHKAEGEVYLQLYNQIISLYWLLWLLELPEVSIVFWPPVSYYKVNLNKGWVPTDYASFLVGSLWKAHYHASFICIICQSECQGGCSPGGLFSPKQLCCNRTQVACVHWRTCLIFSLQTWANPLCISVVILLFTFPPY